jgi:Reverse transcriptase (RNA-dependent DNA polymerase)
LATANNLIDINQFAYQNNVSLDEAILTKTDFIFDAFNNNKNVLAIYLDLTRAFETINHNLLLAKLEKSGFQNKSILLLKNYLQNRKQTTIVNNSESLPLITNVGVPQGTILGPWLFILFLNDIFKVCNLPKIICFADDTLLLYEIEKKQNECPIEINLSLNKYSNWFSSNLLLLNQDKSKFMIYSTFSKNRQDKVIINLGSYNIKGINSFKYLGLLFDSNLKWTSQITSLLTKLKVMCKFAYYLSKVLDTKMKLIWYYAFIYSLLANYSIILGSTNSNLLCKVQSRHYKIIKILFYREIYNESLKSKSNGTNIVSRTFISNDMISNYMCQLKIFNYFQISQYHIINFILKQRSLFINNNNNRFNINFQGNKMNNSDTTLRSILKIKIPFYSKTVGQFKLNYRAATIFNTIPSKILVTFFNNHSINKNCIKEYVLNKS